jgi:pimeloyl-ACP methyl ester carboxylesterase
MFYQYQSSRISYICYGRGPRLLLCFHGYGESAASFAFLEEALHDDFTVIAIDLPFHGDTDWKEGLYLDPAQLLSIVEAIVAGLPGTYDGWTLLGYSMGGRVALTLFQLAPDKISRLVLLATDGLQMNPWYWIATQTRAGNRLFRWTMKRPGWLFFLLRTGHVLRVVNPSIFKFTAHYIDDDQVRENLYIRWTTMRGFRPHLPAIGALIRSRGIPVQLLYGSYDRIIRWERGERFRRPNAPFCQLTLLTAGHQLLQPKFLDVIVKAL